VICVGLGVGKGGGSWGAIYLVETGLELGQDVCHDFIVEGAEGVDSGRSVQILGAFRCCLLGRRTVRITMAFLQLQ
jgi:hypothetical protein